MFTKTLGRMLVSAYPSPQPRVPNFIPGNGGNIACLFLPSHRVIQVAQSEIRAMTLACAKVNGVNLAQGVCDTEVPTPRAP